jgi:hypothetical protein
MNTDIDCLFYLKEFHGWKAGEVKQSSGLHKVYEVTSKIIVLYMYVCRGCPNMLVTDQLQLTDNQSFSITVRKKLIMD